MNKLYHSTTPYTHSALFLLSYSSMPNRAKTKPAMRKYDSNPLTSTKLVMAGAAMTLGSNPNAKHTNGMDDPKVAAMVDTKGKVQKMTVATCVEIPMP